MELQALQKIPIAVVQMKTYPGDIRRNLNSIREHLARARTFHAKIVVFPELATSGYLLGDRWEHEAFIQEIEKADEEIRRMSEGLVVIWGSVTSDPTRLGEDGRVRKYNAARIAHNGRWVSNGALLGWIPKTNLPKYRIFDDARHFYPGDKLAAEMKLSLAELLQPFSVIVDGKYLRLAVTVCEDLWEDEYNTKPSQIYAKNGADLLIDISCSPWANEKWHARDEMLRRRVKDAKIPILYVNSVGLQNNTKNLVWFDGDSALISAEGNFIWRARQHLPHLFLIDETEWKNEALPPRRYRRIIEIYEAIIPAMQEFFAPFKKVVIGLSGGIDSAVSAALLTDALGPEKVLAINMPTRFNSKTTQNLAAECAKRLGIEYKVVPISALVEAHCQMLFRAGYNDTSSLVEENIQARIRGASVLAAIAQAEEGVFICNGNKTEIALNYFTLYGDGAGAAAFLADLWKGQVYEMAEFLNRNREIIPQGILNVVPSAELSSAQNVDEGKGDPIFYPYHDKLLRAFTEWRWDPTVVLTHTLTGRLEEKLGCPQGTINHFFKSPTAFVENLEWAWRQYNIEFKRVQTPPVFLTSRRAFGFDRRDTIAEGYLTDAYEVLKGQLLKRERADSTA